MSEPVSAFAAYRATNAAKANKKSGANNSKNKNNSRTKANKGRTSTGAGAGTARKRTNNNNAANRGKNVENGGSCPRKLTDNKATAKSKTTTTKRATANNAKDKPGRKSNSKQGGGIHASQVDDLVDQLLTDPSKKLTKAEQKKKAELEAYLVRQLEKDDEGEGEDEDDFSSDSDSESDSGSEDDDDDDSQRQVYTDEFTLNSYSDSDDEEEESSTENSTSNLESSSTGIEISIRESTARKRKSNGELSKPANKSKEKEKAKTTTTNKPAKQNNANASKEKAKECKRKSLSKSLEKQTTITTATTSNAIQPHNVAANSTAIETNITTTIKSATKTTTTTSAANSCPRVMNGGGGAGVVKQEPHSPEASLVKSSSIAEGEKLFRWLLNPLAVDEFFSKYWEEHVCLVKRKMNATYYENLISFRDIDQMLLDNHVEFTKHIDITSYRNGARETHNPDGRALPPAVWQQYSDGCSVRLLNPHFFMPTLYTLNATMQEYFHCLVGANAYLTPPNSQGFAPHYDDIEAFVLQVEGRKRWRLYKPRNVNEQLPRTSSMNLPQADLGKPILDVVLQPGDLLYFPRGIIHQACTEPGFHSLHVTLSVYQKQAYADLFEQLMPAVLEQAIKTTVDLRRGVPLHLWQHAGLVHENAQTQERAEIMRKITQLFRKTLSAAPLEKLVDKAVDQLAKKYQREALPPELHTCERKRTIYGSQSRTNAGGECECDYKMELRTNVRLLRAHIVRLVREEQQYRLYYYADNSREYCEFPPSFIEIEARECASVEVLINSYPQYVGVAQLPLDNDEDKIDLATALWERGLLMVEKPFK